MAFRGDRPRIGQVAELAGVSATTVSHALNGRRPVSAETRQRIMDAIAELGYRPDVAARGLRAGRSLTIGLVIPDITNPFYPVLARGVQDVLGPAGYDEIITNTNGVRDLERAALDKMISRQVDGVAFAVFHTHAADLQPVIDAQIPVVRLGGRAAQTGVDLVHSDDEGGARDAVRHLIHNGYRRIAFICGPAAEGPAAERVAGYRTALAEAGIGPQQNMVVHTDFSRAGGAHGVEKLIRQRKRPDAVLCANDMMAIGVMRFCRESGIAIPGQVSITGFDDIAGAEFLLPSLSTVAQPGHDMGKAAAELLLHRTGVREAPPPSTRFATTVRIRDSVAPPR